VVRARPILPAGHGEVVERPGFDEWAALVSENQSRASGWTFEFAGLGAQEFRRQARAELLDVAERFSAKLGVEVRTPARGQAPIVATGHQPDLYHPGVWAKDFLLERLARQVGADAVDVVVDSDGFESVAVTSPCMQPGIGRCRQYLAVGATDTAYAFAPVPDDAALAEFCSSGDAMLATLPAPAVARHFAAFCEALRGSAPNSDNLAELITISRRRYEASAHTSYLEAPLTRIAHTRSFRRFVCGVVLDAAGFAAAYNAELDRYRAISKTRSLAQPFPNLAVGEGGVELPLWDLARHRRQSVWARPNPDGGTTLLAGGEPIAELPADYESALDALETSDVLIAPKALALTLFVRLFCCDLFIHGIGGGRYDQVTDGVIRNYFGVEPPAFVVASMTMYLPLGAHVVSDEEVGAARERLNRLEHNPDALLGEVEFDSEAERDRATDLAAEKTRLIERIATPGADKKALGSRIREVNAELGQVLEPLRSAYETELDGLEAARAAGEILTDRTYPFCFWDPSEIADKVW